MCGRFVRKRTSKVIANEFNANHLADEMSPSFNIAPTQNVAVILVDGERHLVSKRWGLIPAWATNPTIGGKLINARAETLSEKAAFKDAFKRRRCLVVADGFFEWQKEAGSKVPMVFQLKSGRSFGFAG